MALGRSHTTAIREAWLACATVLLTPDKASYNGVKPSRPLSLSGEGGFGAVEIVFRYSGYRANDAIFAAPTTGTPSFADPEKAARSASNLAVGANWYLNANTRIAIDYLRTTFTGGASNGGNRPTEDALFGRLQVNL